MSLSAKLMNTPQSFASMLPLESNTRSTSAAPKSEQGAIVSGSLGIIGGSVTVKVGVAVGFEVGATVGICVGATVGLAVGCSEGVAEGDGVALALVGGSVGLREGTALGKNVGTNEPRTVGENVGELVASDVASGRYVSTKDLTCSFRAYKQLA